jgi:hypothetical protein
MLGLEAPGAVEQRELKLLLLAERMVGHDLLVAHRVAHPILGVHLVQVWGLGAARGKGKK